MIPTILLADDHIMISRSLRMLFNIDFGYRNIESVTNCSGVLKFLKKQKFTHLIIDIGLSDGSSLEILPVIKSVYPRLKIMVYSARPSSVYVLGLHKLGIDDYLSKEENEHETIRRFGIFLGDYKKGRLKSAEKASPFSALTGRQLQVMHYLLNGKTGNEVAAALNVKSNTVSTLKNQLFERTGTRNLIELAELASLYRIG